MVEQRAGDVDRHRHGRRLCALRGLVLLAASCRAQIRRPHVGGSGAGIAHPHVDRILRIAESYARSGVLCWRHRVGGSVEMAVRRVGSCVYCRVFRDASACVHRLGSAIDEASAGCRSAQTHGKGRALGGALEAHSPYGSVYLRDRVRRVAGSAAGGRKRRRDCVGGGVCDLRRIVVVKMVQLRHDIPARLPLYDGGVVADRPAVLSRCANGCDLLRRGLHDAFHLHHDRLEQHHVPFRHFCRLVERNRAWHPLSGGSWRMELVRIWLVVLAGGIHEHASYRDRCICGGGVRNPVFHRKKAFREVGHQSQGGSWRGRRVFAGAVGHARIRSFARMQSQPA